MFWSGHGYGMGLAWVGLFFALLILAALIVLVVRSFTAGSHGGPGGHPGSARAILEDRLVRGDITPDQYREVVRALDETPPPPPRG